MAQLSSIEWTDATWNPTRGCTEIAPGCAHCYAKTFAERWRGVPGHPYELGFDPRVAPDKLLEPLKWKKPRRIFVDSMSDLFHETFSFDYIAAVFGVMAACADRDIGHVFQVLTKRPQRAREFFRWLLGDGTIGDGYEKLRVQSVLHEAVKYVVGYETPGRPAVNILRGWPLPNVWIGTSIANQTDADKNIPHLLQIPAAVRFLSIEPLIGPVNLSAIARHTTGYKEPSMAETSIDALRGSGTYPSHLTGIPIDVEFEPIQWVIVGGESGPGARPCNVEWIRSIQAQCIAAGVPVFTKQLGAKPFVPLSYVGGIESHPMMQWPASVTWGEHDNAAHPILDDRKGGSMNEWPADLRVREFPEGQA
jgi:protein gp37